MEKFLESRRGYEPNKFDLAPRFGSGVYEEWGWLPISVDYGYPGIET